MDSFLDTGNDRRLVISQALSLPSHSLTCSQSSSEVSRMSLSTLTDACATRVTTPSGATSVCCWISRRRSSLNLGCMSLKASGLPMLE